MYAPSKPGDQPSVEVGRTASRMTANNTPITQSAPTELCYSGLQGVHDVPKQAAFRVFLGQGAVLPWGDYICQCPHSGKTHNS